MRSASRPSESPTSARPSSSGTVLRASRVTERSSGRMLAPEALLPEVRDNSGIFGTTATGLFDIQLPIAGMAGDQQAALFGQACFASGMAKSTYGTGCFMLVNTGERAVLSGHRLLTTPAY